MKREITVLMLVTMGVTAAPLFARAGGCCGSDAGAMAGCAGMAGHEMAGHDGSAAAVPVKLPQQVASVFDSYGRIQEALAKDSLEGVAANAQVIAKAAKEDAAGSLPAGLAQQSDTLAGAKDLAGARKAFKGLSDSLIGYAAKNPHVAGYYRQVHCSMADASWLQTGSVVNNPYMGKAMARCGEFVTTSAPEKQAEH